MIELGRSSKLVGKGFFDYDENGKRTGLWPGLAETFPVADEQPPFQDIKDRLVFVMSLDTVRCLEEGVLRTVPDANIGSIFGIGFPPMHGGALQYINGYEAPDGRIGVEAFTERAQELAAEVRLALRAAGPAARQGEERREVRLGGHMWEVTCANVMTRHRRSAGSPQLLREPCRCGPGSDPQNRATAQPATAPRTRGLLTAVVG